MSHSPTQASTAEASPADPAARWPLTLLAGSALVWLVLSSLLALVTAIQLHTPSFLADCSALTHGRAQALRETAFLYGWAGNAGVGLGLWILGRLGGHPLRALNWAVVGTVFWNLGLLAGMVGIATGSMTGFAGLQLPRAVQPVLVAAYCGMALPGVLAWAGRKREGTYAAQWYAVAALFLLPWFWTATQAVLLWSPLRGVVQTVAASWHAQSLVSLWLMPLALAAAYYVIPKQTGRLLPGYESAPLSFWTLIVVGGWNFGRHLIGGPVPAWIPTMAVVAQCLLLFHFLVIALNFRPVLAGGSLTLQYLRFGLVAYLLSGLLETLTSFRGVAVHTQFTLLVPAMEQLTLQGALSMFLFAGLVYQLPRVLGRDWTLPTFVSGHGSLYMLGVVVSVLSLGWAGLAQDALLNHSQTPFAEILAQLKTPLLLHTAGQFALLAGNLLLLVAFLRSAAASCCREAGASVLRPASSAS